MENKKVKVNGQLFESEELALKLIQELIDKKIEVRIVRVKDKSNVKER